MDKYSWNEKLDIADTDAYVIEEEIDKTATDVYEDYLKHDNVDTSTISVFTGSKRTGTQIQDYTVSIPSDKPWKVKIKVNTTVDKIYIIYETKGDINEADDINRLQECLEQTQTELIALGEEVRGQTGAYTWGKLMGV